MVIECDTRKRILSRMAFILLLCGLVLIEGVVGATDGRFIKLFNQDLGGRQVSESEFLQIVNYDLWVSASKLSGDLPGGYANTWQRAKSMNPDLKIVLYKHGTATMGVDDTNPLCFRTTADRVETIKNNYPHLILKEFTAYDKPGLYVDWGYGEDAGETRKKWYEILWDAIKQDTMDQSCYDHADGIFLDELMPAYMMSSGRWPKYYDDNCIATPDFSCPDTLTGWGHHMWWFAGNIMKLIHESGNIASFNAGTIRTTEEFNSLMAYERDSHLYLDKPDHIENEFGPWGTTWAGCVEKYGCTFQWYGEADWRNSIDGLQLTEEISILYQGILRTKSIGDDMIDQDGNRYGFYQMLWFGMASFLLGNSGNDFFGTDTLEGDSYGEANWWGEYDEMMPEGNLHLGDVVDSGYKVSNGIYYREYEKGYVIVNPSKSSKGRIDLNALFGTQDKAYKVLDHWTFSQDLGSLPEVKAVDLQGYTGLIIRKVGADVGEIPIIPAEHEAIATWNFDEGTGTVVRDSAGNSDGVINGASWTSDSISGTALRFDGTDDFVDMGNPAALNTVSAVTISCWIKPETSAVKDIGVVYSHGWFNAENRHLAIGIDKATGKVRYVLGNGNNHIEMDSNGALSFDTWHHVALAWSDDTDRYEIFVDGVLDKSGSYSGPLSLEPYSYIGKASWGSRFKGSIDEVSIYNRALTGQEVWDESSGRKKSPCTDADVDADGMIDISELQDYISGWKDGTVDIKDLIDAIGMWRSGC